MFGLPFTYTSRSSAAYFADTLPESHLWQSDVYRLAARLAHHAGIGRLVDVGCGRGKKLIPYADELEITGIDYQQNIEYCRDTYAWGTWVDCDLEKNIPNIHFEKSVTLCADVIEHLSDPTALLQTLRNACETAAFVLLSTPDRARLYGRDHRGPPGKPGTHPRMDTRRIDRMAGRGGVAGGVVGLDDQL